MNIIKSIANTFSTVPKKIAKDLPCSKIDTSFCAKQVSSEIDSKYYKSIALAQLPNPKILNQKGGT